ncbi:zinc finger protein 26-like [Cloeon dipterum]|uniref:zinc finger protein 26-like n=1 Tax=Cloeon dipterum TaxID=197152 RepID=UPI00321FA815
MDSKCQLCCKRNGEVCRTNYFQQLITKHLNFNFEGALCICESCGQLLRHWDEFSADAQENLFRQTTEPDSCQPDCFEGKSCDQETQTDFESDQPTVHDHSYAKTPDLYNYVEDESCQVDSSTLEVHHAAHEYPFINDFSDSSFYERPDSEIKIVEVCALKDVQWIDDPIEKEDFEYGVEPEVKIKEEPPDHDEYEESEWPDEYYSPLIPANDHHVFKMDHHQIKDEAEIHVPNSPTDDCKIKQEIVKEEVKEEPLPAAPAPLPLVQPAPKVHCCPICSIDFPSNDLLVKHLRSHENFFKPAVNLACPDCNQEFLSEHILIEHIMEYHFYTNERGEVSCVICGQLQSSGAELRKHIFNCHFNTNPHPTHSSGVVSAEVAKKKTASVEDEVKKVTTFSCKLCNVKLASKAKLQQHVDQKHKGKKIVLKRANEKNNAAAQELTVRKETGHKGLKLHSERNNRFYCKLCMKSFPNARGAVCHISKVHKQQYNLAPKTAESTIKGPFHCKKCKKVFVYLKRYKSHVCVAPASQPEKSRQVLALSSNYVKMSNGLFKCKICMKKLNSYSGMAKHLRKNHRQGCKLEEGKNNVPEPQGSHSRSEKRTDSRVELTCSREVRALKETQPFKSCDEYSPNLPPRDKIYTRMKRRQQMFACEACNRHFMTKRQLRIHRKKLCKETRASLTPMARYCLQRRAHFLCNVCYKTDCEFEFKSESEVILHLDIDHNLTLQSVVAVQFVCKFCNQLYKYGAYLKTHIKQKHKDELEESLKVPTDSRSEKDKVIEAEKIDKPENAAEKDQPEKPEPEAVDESISPAPLKMYKCLICGKLLPLQIALQRHMKIKHPPASIIKTEPVEEEDKPADDVPEPPSPSAITVNRNECAVCGKVFKLSIALQKHMLNHSENPPSSSLKPTAPSEPAPVILTIKQESIPSGNPPGSDSFKCQICSKAFADGEQLAAHSKNHFVPRVGADEQKKGSEGSKSVKKGLLACDLCDKGLSFFSQVALDQHKRKYHKPT